MDKFTDKFTDKLVSGQRYIFYEKKDDTSHIIFEAEFIDIIKGIYDTIRVCKYQYIADNLIDYGEMNNAMLTMPTDWIIKVVCKNDNDLLKQVSWLSYWLSCCGRVR